MGSSTLSIFSSNAGNIEKIVSEKTPNKNSQNQPNEPKLTKPNKQKTTNQNPKQNCKDFLPDISSLTVNKPLEQFLEI